MKAMSHVKIELNFLQYLHEKAQESRNREIQGCLIFLAGAVFFVGGMLESLSLTENPEWFIFVPYHTKPIPGGILGLTLIISGLIQMVFGVVTALRWRMNRKWYMERLRKASSKEWSELTQNRSVDISKPSLSKPSMPEPSIPKLKTLGEWWVYDDWAVKPSRARVHKGTCFYCNHGKGVNPDKTVEGDRRWRGPYPTWRKAWKATQKLEREDTAFCKKCCRELNDITNKQSAVVASKL
jgi:hypothetical protein